MTKLHLNETRNLSSWVIEDESGKVFATCSFRDGNKDKAKEHAELIVYLVNKHNSGEAV